MPGPTQRELRTAIRRKCMDCTNNQTKEVRICELTDCDLWPYRMGKDHKVQHLKPVEKPIQITPKEVA